MQYCFDIKNTGSVPVIPSQLKNYVKNLYKDQFEKEDEDLPFITIYAESDKSVCIILTGRSKKSLELIEAINGSLTEKQLRYKGIKLSRPYVFDVDTCAWWEDDKEGKSAKRWTNMTHRGPYFGHLMEPYKHLKSYLTYDGKKYYLNPEEEKAASFYAKRLISEKGGGVTEILTENNTFNKNFFADFVTYLSPEKRKVFKNIGKVGWDDLVEKIERNKPSELTKAEKREKRVATEERKREYGYAFLDGKREKVGNFIVEPASIFMGRGKNPNMGRIKREVYPEDVTINVGAYDPIPVAPMGHEWGSVVHDSSAEWLARWKDTITGDPKYVRFGAEGKFKSECDFVKYEKARKLERHIDTVRGRYMADVNSNDLVKKQLGTVLYLIDHFGIRVGGEKGDDETDTVGASTLRVGHIKLSPPTKVIFDFLGKDSIRYYKELNVPREIFRNIKEFTEGKGKDTDLFDRINASRINEYLKQFDKVFTAKVFRTRLASVRMYNALKKVQIPEGSTKQKTKVLFNKANAEVADILNHTRNISKKAKEAVEKLQDKLKELKEERKEKVREGKSTKSIDSKIETTKSNIEGKNDTLNVAITTSLTNYIDPRVVVAWCESQVITPDYIYTATLLKKFTWAIEMTEPGWDYIDSPLAGPYELDPAQPKSSPSSSTKSSTRLTRRTPTKSSTRRGPIHREIPVSRTPGTIDEWKALLNICRNPDRYGYKLGDISEKTLRYTKNISEYILANGMSKSKANEYIIKYYNAVYS